MQGWPSGIWAGTGVQSFGFYLPLFILVLAYFYYKLQQRRREYEVSRTWTVLCPHI